MIKLLKFLPVIFPILFGCSHSESTLRTDNDLKPHLRILNKNFEGDTLSLKNFFSKPIELFIPDSSSINQKSVLLIHFHGSSYVPKAAVQSVNRNIVLAVINLGIGSSVYEKPFLDGEIFTKLICSIDSTLDKYYQADINFSEIYLSSFSAGYGAVRRILQFQTEKIAGVLLLDGMHTDYIPDGTELSKGGSLNTEKLDLYLQLAYEAIAGKKRFVISHSDIYPAAYASNKETADYLIARLNLKRKNVDETGPVGMHKTSEVAAGNFFVFGFDGDGTRDHVDQYHSMPELLCILLNCEHFIQPEYLHE
jgi:hypothetical protein